MPMRRVREIWVRAVLLVSLLLGLPMPALAQNTDQPQPDKGTASIATKSIYDLDIKQLAEVRVAMPSMGLPVTSVTKEESTVGRSAAAVFVITNEMIRRSGATCIPEALRMAPGLDVAHINSNTWAISSRGFNGFLANKLLVLIDGRTVYVPTSSGVYWDVQDVLLEDVDRIEVIRGPGGTLWGSNAVNGVINVITKKANDTQGSYVGVGGGTQERMNDGVRYGSTIGEDFHYRVYGKHFERGPGVDPTGPAEDSWRQGRFGFRSDWNVDKADTLTVQGDCYTGESGMTAKLTSTVSPFFSMESGNIDNSGQNVIARWRHVNDEDSDWTLQTYFDNYLRDTILTSERVRTFDVDFQYRFPLTDRQSVTCGAGYRYIHEQLPSEHPFTLASIPPETSFTLGSQFIQDEIQLVDDRLVFTTGVKLEENTYTGLEYQPTGRLLWAPDKRHTAWGAVSRAVRIPGYEEHGALFATTVPAPGSPVFGRIRGNDGMISEVLWAYELGYRTQATDKFSYDIATFYNVYNGLSRTVAVGGPSLEFVPPPPHLVLPLTFTNGTDATTYGVELATNWSISDHWRLSTQYTFLRILTTPINAVDDGGSPKHQIYMRSSWDLQENIDFDLTLRYVDCLKGYNVPSYITMDARLAWRPQQYKHLELALVGQNLLQGDHQEFGTIQIPGYEVTYVPRGVYGTAAWRY